LVENINLATKRTANFNTSLAADQTVTLGTCGVVGGSGSGDTFLRLFDMASTEGGPSGALADPRRMVSGPAS